MNFGGFLNFCYKQVGKIAEPVWPLYAFDQLVVVHMAFNPC